MRDPVCRDEHVVSIQNRGREESDTDQQKNTVVSSLVAHQRDNASDDRKGRRNRFHRGVQLRRPTPIKRPRCHNGCPNGNDRYHECQKARLAFRIPRRVKLAFQPNSLVGLRSLARPGLLPPPRFLMSPRFLMPKRAFGRIGSVQLRNGVPESVPSYDVAGHEISLFPCHRDGSMTNPLSPRRR